MQGAENRKRGKKRSRLGWWCVGLLAAAVAAAYPWRSELARASRDLRDALFYHAYFSVREIKVRGGEKVGGNEIATMAGLRHGMQIWSVDPVATEATVAKHPWVKRVVVRREFPHRVVIEVEERAAKAVLVLGRLFYVDADGFVFKEVGGGEPVNLLMLTGVKQDEITAAPQSTREKIREALRLGELAERASLGPSEVRFLDDEGVVLYPMRFPVAMHMGWGDWEEKLERLEQVLALWQGKESQLAALSVNFSDQVVARLRKVQG
jgi:cell division protein FtsQ